jgi:hypothetical protein
MEEDIKKRRVPRLCAQNQALNRAQRGTTQTISEGEVEIYGNGAVALRNLIMPPELFASKGAESFVR